MTESRLLPSLVIALTMGFTACSQEETLPFGPPDPPPLGKRVFFLEAPCEINVEGVGVVDIEEEYIPGVVACENGNAPTEALKAQAVQARSFLYYKMFVRGQTTIGDSQSDQVYSCSYRPDGPGPEHYAAAEATKGQYLEWDGSIVASFYVAAAIPPNPDANDPWNSCMGNGGNDPTNTQQWVTYNRGKSACQIDMTGLGTTPPDCRDNPYNRGCASQNGQTCLASVGVEYQHMFSMFYGDDIELVVADGRCGGEPFSSQDEFCLQRGTGVYCLDAGTKIECGGGRAVMTEECTDGCGEGECLPPPDPTFCTDQADGSYCDGATRIDCVGSQVSVTEACPNGCAMGACVVDDGGDNNMSGNNGTGGPNNDGDGDNNDDGGNPGDPGSSGALPPVIGASPGVEGGCTTSTIPRGSHYGVSGLLLLAGFLSFRRRRT